MSYNRNISKHERILLFEMGYVIREHWIGPLEGYEYTLCRAGESAKMAIVTRKSERACFNHARELDAADAR